MVENFADWKKPPPPLKKRITCTSTKCEAGLHSFQTNMRLKVNRDAKKSYRNGSCNCCGEDNLVDWERIDKRNFDDSDYLVSRLKLEMFRKNYWENPFDDIAIKKLKNKSFSDLEMNVKKVLKKTLTKPRHEQLRDGSQTKLSGNVIFYAQHATATCCRKCMEEWHNVSVNDTINNENLQYAIDLVMLYLKKRLPSICKSNFSKTKKSDSNRVYA